MSARQDVTSPSGFAGFLLALGLTLTLVAIVILSIQVPAPVTAAPSVSGEPPDAGGGVCAVGTSGDEAATALVITAVSDTDADTADDEDIDDVAARISLLVLDDVPQRVPVDSLGAGELLLVQPSLGTTGWVWAGWADRATVTWREWSSAGGPGVPRGRGAAPCVPTSAALAVFPGLRTDGGNEAYLTLANPFPSDATFAVTFLTPEGSTEPIALRNVSVSAGERVVLRVNDHLPREADLAAIVTIGAGRLAVEGHQLALAGVGGIDGLSLVQASTAASTSWTLPWLVEDESSSTWVSIVNPDARSVTLDVVVHTATGPELPEGFESITVPPLGLLRVPATSFAPRGQRTFGVTLTSETTGVHVSAGLEVTGEEVEATGISTFLGSPAADARWVVAGTAAPERSTVLHVVNLGEQSADVAITLRVRSSGEGASSLRPLPAVVVPAGGVSRIVLPLPEDGIWSVEVTGPPQLVVARSASGVTVLEPVVTPAVPSAAWRRPVEPLAGWARSGWARALGTDADLRPTDTPVGALPPLSPQGAG